MKVPENDLQSWRLPLSPDIFVLPGGTKSFFSFSSRIFLTHEKVSPFLGWTNSVSCFLKFFYLVCSDSAAGSLVRASLLTWPANAKISAFESNFLMRRRGFCAFCVVEHE
jgi:hypothetical protein